MRLALICLSLVSLCGCGSDARTEATDPQTDQGSGGASSSASGKQSTGGRGGETGPAGGASGSERTSNEKGGAASAGGAGKTGTSGDGTGGGGGAASAGGAGKTGAGTSGGGTGKGGGSASGGMAGQSGGSASGGHAGGNSPESGDSGTSLADGSTGVAQATRASDVVAQWKLGWNLGNSLDADGCGAAGSETCWSNPLVTQELLTYVASLGFKVVRIPVTWSEHLGSGPSYTIDATWMSRVDTVVNYALKAGLSAIINLHHDGADGVAKIQWLNIVDASGKVTDANTKAITDEFTAIWTQIAQHFKDYDNRLVFESMNEIHHGYDTPQTAWYDVVNKLNQTFVTTVRGTGGNNASRFLVVPGYNTNIDQTVEGFKLPTDTISNHLILTYHYYDPYKFTITGDTHTWGAAYAKESDGTGSSGQEDYVKTELDKIKSNYIDHGVPAIMGEYGAMYQAGYEEYRRYWTEYVTKAAHDRGIAPIFWDPGSDLIDRSKLSIRYSDIYDAMVRASTSNYSLDQVAAPKP